MIFSERVGEHILYSGDQELHMNLGEWEGGFRLEFKVPWMTHLYRKVFQPSSLWADSYGGREEVELVGLSRTVWYSSRKRLELQSPDQAKKRKLCWKMESSILHLAQRSCPVRHGDAIDRLKGKAGTRKTDRPCFMEGYGQDLGQWHYSLRLTIVLTLNTIDTC